MINRKEKFKKKKLLKKVKWLIGTLFLSIGVGSSITVAFADQDIQGLLSNWFAKQQTKSVETIQNAIMSEKEIQLQRLKEELQLEIANAKKQLDQYTKEEKEQRITNLRAYTDELIKNLNVDNTKEKQTVTTKLNAIVNEAISAMDNVIKTENANGKPAKQPPTANAEQITVNPGEN